ncbi:hypothetical protein [Sporosarcina sp. FSL K6-3457]|uniref:hypothetical protein n=1 Tax=Sporosarcina sp. FSL K6-3457 TaxID=2978204 RepID=UPI0030F567FA
MMQFKLFELLDNESTYNDLISLFGKQAVYKFSNSIIGITYDYGANNYVEILKKVKNFNLRQVIITSSSFLRAINYGVDKDIQINEIKFIYPILPESVIQVQDYIEMINATEGEEKKYNKNKLFKEIDWITSDECIDIKCISFDLKNEEQLYYKTELYNNGVLLVNDKTIIKNVAEFINNTL